MARRQPRYALVGRCASSECLRVSVNLAQTCFGRGRSSADWLLNYRGQAYSSSPFRWQGAGGYSRSLAHYLWALEQAGYTQDYLRRSPSVDGLAAEKARCLQEPFEPTYQELAAEIGQLVAEGNYAEARAWSSAWKGGGPYMAWVVRRLDLLQQEKNGRKH